MSLDQGYPGPAFLEHLDHMPATYQNWSSSVKIMAERHGLCAVQVSQPETIHDGKNGLDLVLSEFPLPLNERIISQA